MFIRKRLLAGTLVAVTALAVHGWRTADAGVPTDQPFDGRMTYYNDRGYSACGTQIDASSQDLVAVSHEWWTSANPNEDNLCKGVSVQVTYGGKTITVPVADMCPSCDAEHVDLSQTAFEKLAPLSVGLVTGITWKFVTEDGGRPAPFEVAEGDHETSSPSTHAEVTGEGFPARYTAPYVETWRPPSAMADAQAAAGLKYFTLAFVLDGGNCRAAFNGSSPISGSEWLAAVDKLRASGGDVIASFGGAAGIELGLSCKSVASLKAQYKSVIDTLNLTRVDFDIEGSALADTAANDRRNQALAQLQREYTSSGKRLDVQYTLPTNVDGLEQNGLKLLENAKSNGLDVNLVNIMTMDYGPPADMGEAAISAAQGLHVQLGKIWPFKSSDELWAMEGNTPMLGVNDITSEVFDTDDAAELKTFASSQGIRQLSFWALGRDKACPDVGMLSDQCSGTPQSDYEFTRIFDSDAGDEQSRGSTPPSTSLSSLKPVSGSREHP
ncbi:cysteine/serine endopeptidase inhibitor [Streptomyces sp. NPDC056707]|uniref:cysteine/serine endopeptidase inhibitor n=1 Tax=Streptomyces sp. NPDC056707 TaxID=3345919 RepID=UPI0036801F77